MAKKMVGLVAIGLVLITGEALGMPFSGMDFGAGGDSAYPAYYFPVENKEAVDKETIGPWFPLTTDAVNFKVEELGGGVKEATLEGPFEGGFIPDQQAPGVGEVPPLVLEANKARDYLRSLIEKLPANAPNAAGQKALLQQVIDLINKTTGARIEVMLRPTGEDTLAMALDVFDKEGQFLARATIDLKADKKETAEKILSEFQVILQEKDPKAQATKFDALFRDEISKLAVVGSEVTKIKEKSDLPKEQMGAEFIKQRDEMKKAIDAAKNLNPQQKTAIKGLIETAFAGLALDKGSKQVTEVYDNGRLARTFIDYIITGKGVRLSVTLGPDNKVQAINLSDPTTQISLFINPDGSVVFSYDVGGGKR
jgi:hypothetical protein